MPERQLKNEWGSLLAEQAADAALPTVASIPRDGTDLRSTSRKLPLWKSTSRNSRPSCHAPVLSSFSACSREVAKEIAGNSKTRSSPGRSRTAELLQDSDTRTFLKNAMKQDRLCATPGPGRIFVTFRSHCNSGLRTLKLPFSLLGPRDFSLRRDGSRGGKSSTKTDLPRLDDAEIESILNTVKVCCPVKLETSRRSSFGSPATLQFSSSTRARPLSRRAVLEQRRLDSSSRRDGKGPTEPGLLSHAR